MRREIRRAGWRFWAVLGGAIILLTSGLGSTTLWAPDEPRYAQIAEEVRATERGPSDWVLLHLNGAPYSQKPPLYYWLAALTGAPGGHVSEVAARLPSALAGIATVVLTWLFGVRLLGPAAGLWGAAVLLSVYRFSHLARRAQLDILLTLFEGVALLAFWRLDQGGDRRSRDVALFHGAMGLAVLTKGPVGLLPLVIAAIFRVVDGRRREALHLGPAWAWTLSLAPGLVWLGSALWLAPEGFFGDAVVDNVLGRFFTGTSHVRPFYYFFYQLPADFLPWTLLFPWIALGWRRDAAARAPHARAYRFLSVWIAVPFVFFSLSAGKRGLYLLPIFPALALLCGAFLEQRLSARARLPSALTRSLALTGFVLATAGVALAASGGLAVASDVTVPGAFGAWIAAVALGSVAAVLTVRRRGGMPPGHGVGIAVGAFVALLLGIYTIVYPALEATKSPRPVAESARELAGPGGPVGVFDYRSLVGAMAYYAGRPVVELPDASSAERFVDEGGSAIVSRARHVEVLAQELSPSVHSRHRSGSRELVVLEVRAREPLDRPR